MLSDQHLYPPSIAETLAALQRTPDTMQPSSSRYGMQVRAAHRRSIILADAQRSSAELVINVAQIQPQQLT